MEVDAYFFLMLAISAWAYHDAAFAAVIAGLYRYLFVFVHKLIPPVPVRKNCS